MMMGMPIGAQDGVEADRLEMNAISKAFPGVQALDDVSFRLKAGEIHALIGENGAGKSTLVKILSGAYQKDAGSIFLDGVEVEIDTPLKALELGIVTIYQESNLSLELSVAENVFMGRLPKRGFFVEWGKLHAQTQELLDELNVAFSPTTIVKELSAAERQMVEIAKALSMSARVIVLDEPTATLTEREVEVLFQVVCRLKDLGASIIFITHRLKEVFELADRVTVLRDGQWVSTNPIDEIESEDQLVYRMVGRQLENLYLSGQSQSGEMLLSVENLSGERFKDVTFDIRSGEIVGMFGLVGSGRTNVVRALFGAHGFYAGQIRVLGQVIEPKLPRDSIRAGLALVPEDRKAQGLVLDFSVRKNITLPNLREVSQAGFINARAEKRMSLDFKESLDIRCPSIETEAKALSGGNQQKVVVAKWLSKQPRILILDEPTRGIDVAGKAEVHRLMGQLAAQGVGVLMVSSELPEILGMSDRVLVMHEGRLVANIPRQEATEEIIMSYAAGKSAASPAA